jgi:hypothetical protein
MHRPEEVNINREYLNKMVSKEAFHESGEGEDLAGWSFMMGMLPIIGLLTLPVSAPVWGALAALTTLLASALILGTYTHITAGTASKKIELVVKEETQKIKKMRDYLLNSPSSSPEQKLKDLNHLNQEAIFLLKISDKSTAWTVSESNDLEEIIQGHQQTIDNIKSTAVKEITIDAKINNPLKNEIIALKSGIAEKKPVLDTNSNTIGDFLNKSGDTSKVYINPPQSNIANTFDQDREHKQEVSTELQPEFKG